ncbi:hypothetical protein SAMN05428989_1974 [Pseudoxanthomonas sp. GM95]|uniref:hypothetical protein n=1 Tax=Pseudoxanthomonas sp. GM95 TaxID=1881043 RepID=UPI0008CD62CB|nr:hypothetical protein [Pseudoxanthomonas sp. GM95]SEL57925.1 hypothetical protein SAMN05428989_1974 [Pseudoxanthomonas sp. GM95]
MNASLALLDTAIEQDILSVAGLLESSPQAVMDWYHAVPIRALGDETAAELVCQGRGSAVMAFLWAVIEIELETNW